MTDTTTTEIAPTDSTPVEWHALDADDAGPVVGPPTPPASTRTARIYMIRITPGDCSTYLAPGFYADVDGGYGQRWGMRAATLDEAKAPRGRGRAAMTQPTVTPADVEASAAKDRHTLSEVACDLIVIEHRLRDVSRWTPAPARAHLDAALSSVATALDALHAEYASRTTEQEQ